MSVDDDFYKLSPEQRRWVMDKLHEYRRNVAYAFAYSDADGQAKAQEELKAYLIQRAKAQDEHEALTRLEKLEKRVEALEKIWANILRTTDFRLFR